MMKLTDPLDTIEPMPVLIHCHGCGRFTHGLTCGVCRFEKSPTVKLAQVKTAYTPGFKPWIQCPTCGERA